LLLHKVFSGFLIIKTVTERSPIHAKHYSGFYGRVAFLTMVLAYENGDTGGVRMHQTRWLL
jgi:hypothetical protein